MRKLLVVSNEEFSAKSVHTKLVLLQAKQLSIHFLLRKNQYCCTFSRGLMKDTQLRNIKRRKKACNGGNKTHVLKSFAQQACAQLLCNCGCPSILLYQIHCYVDVQYVVGNDRKQSRRVVSSIFLSDVVFALKRNLLKNLIQLR